MVSEHQRYVKKFYKKISKDLETSEYPGFNFGPEDEVQLILVAVSTDEADQTDDESIRY